MQKEIGIARKVAENSDPSRGVNLYEMTQARKKIDLNVSDSLVDICIKTICKMIQNTSQPESAAELEKILVNLNIPKELVEKFFDPAYRYFMPITERNINWNGACGLCGRWVPYKRGSRILHRNFHEFKFTAMGMDYRLQRNIFFEIPLMAFHFQPEPWPLRYVDVEDDGHLWASD